MKCKTGIEMFGIIAIFVVFGLAFGWHTEITTTGDLKAQLDDANVTIASLNDSLANVTDWLDENEISREDWKVRVGDIVVQHGMRAVTGMWYNDSYIQLAIGRYDDLFMDVYAYSVRDGEENYTWTQMWNCTGEGCSCQCTMDCLEINNTSTVYGTLIDLENVNETTEWFVTDTTFELLTSFEDRRDDYWSKGRLWIKKEGNYACVLQRIDEHSSLQAGISTDEGKVNIELRMVNETSDYCIWNCTGKQCLNAFPA